jgi:septum formation protein
LIFEVLTTNVEELTDASLGPILLVQENARLKTWPVARLRPDCVVIGADTVVVFGGQIFGKPADMCEAALMLERLNGQEHAVHTGVCLVNALSGRESVFVETTIVRFHKLTDQERIAYHQRIDPLDKAGAYAAQHDNGDLIAATIGSFSNVVGLPMEALTERLRSFLSSSSP